MAIAEYLKRLKDMKFLLATYLNIKGVQADEEERFNTLIPKVLQIRGGKSERKILFHYGSDVQKNYGDNIFTFFQNGIQNLDSYIRNGKEFCCAANQYMISYTQTDFSWDGHVFTASTQPFSVDENTSIVMTYQSGVTEKGNLYLIPAEGKSPADTIQNYIYTSVYNGNRFELPFYWLDCREFISELIQCINVRPGSYYICWLGRSDNTHPMISDISILF